MMLSGIITRDSVPGISYLVYHRVGSASSLEMDITLPVFRKQMEYLASTGKVVTYDDAMKRLASGDIDTDLFVITFDDGYDDFYLNAFPILRSLGLPAMLFVTTGFIEEGVPYPLSTTPLQPVSPVSWDMLGKMRESGLLSIGAHTHMHIELPARSDEEIRNDLSQSRDLFMRRIGFAPVHFAYPRASWDNRTEAFVRGQFESASIGGGRKAVANGYDPYRIPRVPVRRSDGWFFFLAKIRGYLSSEERFYEVLKNMRH